MNNSGKLLKEAKLVFWGYMSNYSGKPGDEDKIDLGRLKITSSKISETETVEFIEKFLVFIEKEIKKNNARFSQDRDDAVMRKIGNHIMKKALNSRKSKVKRNKKVKQKVEKIIKKINQLN